ncbi:MAG: hypothetical protein KA174_05130 [Chitinophagales bacterium]|nr:hypothetical protein [Chitinophagales bacterium]
MLTTINGIFENGKVILSENPPLKNKSKVLVTFIDEIDINKINQKRVIGLLDGKYKVPDNFNEPIEELKDYM